MTNIQEREKPKRGAKIPIKGRFSAAKKVEFTRSLTHPFTHSLFNSLQTASVTLFYFLQTESLVYKMYMKSFQTDGIYRENELKSNQISQPDNTADMRARTARARFY